MKSAISIAAVLLSASFAHAAPEDVKKVLFFSKSSSFEHSVIRHVNGQPSHVETVLSELGKAHKYEFTFSKDGGIFTPAGLAPFDAVFFYTTGDLTKPGNDGNPPMPANGKQALLDFVAGGKGFIGTHSATDTFHTEGGERSHNDEVCDPYIAMLGGEFITHGSQQPAKIRVADPAFPGMAAVGKEFSMVEEWYALKNFPEDLHVLLVQETADMTGNQKGNPYDRPPYPVSWVRPYGKGRVFYTSLGHKPGTWTNPMFQEMLAGGLDWVTGRVKADVAPNLKEVTPGYATNAVTAAASTVVPTAPTMPAQKPVAGSTGNLALGRAVTDSGSQGGARPNPAGNALDGDESTYWASKTLGAASQWLQVDLGKVETVSGSRLSWTSDKLHYQYRIEGSADALTWKLLLDGSKNTRPSPAEDAFDATEVRYVKFTLTGIEGNPERVRPGLREWKILGKDSGPAKTDAPETPVVPPGTAFKNEATLLEETKVPEGFEASIFAAPPMINYPTFIATAADGTLFVSCDKNGAGGRKPHQGRIVRLRDLDGDGRADEAKDFVADIDTPRGLVWDHDRLYVMHPPDLSVFIDKDGDGVSDEHKVLVKNIGWGFKDRSGDHASDGLELGIDGWLYCAIGDFGFFDAEGTDGKKLRLRGGGVVRVRPDGTGLEIFARGTRNIYGATVDPLLNVFARDNNNDGSWGVLLHHFTGLDHHGYPSLFRNFPEDIVPPLADYVTGSGRGSFYLDEPGIPQKYQGLLTCDWGKSWVYHHPLKKAGATFTAGQEEFIGALRTIDIKADALSRLYVASWRGAIFNYSGEDVGYVARVKVKDYKPKPLPDFAKASTDDLVRLLTSDSQRRRLEAQRALLRTGLNDATVTSLVKLAGDAAIPLEGRVAAIFTLKQGMGSKAHPLLAPLAADPELRPLVIRALADHLEQAQDVPASLVASGLSDPLPRTRLEAAVAIARMGKIGNAASLTPLLGDADPIVRHTAVRALSSLHAKAACFAILDDPKASDMADDGALDVLKTEHDPEVVTQLISRLGEETSALRKRSLLSALCRLHFREGEWKGAGWGLTPDITGPYFQTEAWEETPRIAAVLKEAVKQARGDEAAFLVGELNRHQIHFEEAVQSILALAAQDPRHVPAAVSMLARSGSTPADCIPMLVRAAADQSATDEVRADSVVALARSGSGEGMLASLSVLADFDKKPKAERSRSRPFKKAREAFFTSPSLQKQAPQLTAEASKLKEGTSAWADAALLKANTQEAKKYIEEGWADSKRRVQILRAIALAMDRGSKDRVLSSLSDPAAPVAAAARETARTLRLNPDEKPAAPIGSMKPQAVLARIVKIKGDSALGEQLFAQQGCIACHTVNADEALKAGPYLGGTAGIYQLKELAEMVLSPSKSLAQGYEPHHIVTKGGQEYIGFISSSDNEGIVLRDMAMQQVKITASEVTKNEPLETSLMPIGLADSLTEKEFAALLSYLQSLSNH